MKKNKHLYIIGLALVALSCGTTQKVVPVAPKAIVTPTQPIKVTPHDKLENISGLYFYKENMADITKNNNTISYGSIVSANPIGYTISKSYFPSLAQNFRQRYVILHYTALNDERSIRALTEQSVSAHYLVNDLDDKEIWQLVDENKRAYHAGISQWRNDSNLNDMSIGIEIVNMGFTVGADGKKIFPPFPQDQVNKVAALVKDIVARYNIPATNILGHSDIAPTRKQDPGPQFPWKQLYDQYQLGMWYDEPVKQSFMQQTQTEDFAILSQQPQFIFLYQTKLKELGYGINPSGSIDETTKLTIEAFQYHFRPSDYSGVMDPETWAILQALVQKYPGK